MPVSFSASFYKKECRERLVPRFGSMSFPKMVAEDMKDAIEKTAQGAGRRCGGSFSAPVLGKNVAAPRPRGSFFLSAHVLLFHPSASIFSFSASVFGRAEKAAAFFYPRRASMSRFCAVAGAHASDRGKAVVYWTHEKMGG
jgi:hypothetical protein